MVLPTKTLGSYRLGELIAVGGMARTYRAWRDGEPDYPLCIKLLHNELVENIEFIQMFIDEATIAQSLRHPNIVRVYELGRAGENHFIVMELVEGKDLKQIVERSARRGTRMTPLMVATVIHDVSRALGYVHNKTADDGTPLGIIHRDVSPHNIMLTFEGARVKLTDFGIAKAASRLTRTRTGAVKGKYGYMSPEQAQGRTLDGRSDLFAVGIIMHELLTGQRLFSAETSFEAFAMVLEQPIAPPSSLVPGIDPELDRICLKALERDISRRYASCAEMAADLQSWLEAHIPSRDAIGLPGFLKTLFDLEQGQLPHAEVIHDPKLMHMADLHTQVIPPSPPPTRSQSASILSHDDGVNGTRPAVWLQEQEQEIAEVLPKQDTAQPPEARLKFASATHTDIFDPLGHLHEPTDHGFLDEAYQEHEPPSLDDDIGEPTIPIDVPAMLGVQVNDPYASQPQPAPSRPRVSPQLSASVPAAPRPSAPRTSAPHLRTSPSSPAVPRTPSVATASVPRARPQTPTRPSPTHRPPPPRHNTPTPSRGPALKRSSAPLWIALAGVLLLAAALTLGVAMLVMTSQRDDAVARPAGSDVVVAERVEEEEAAEPTAQEAPRDEATDDPPSPDKESDDDPPAEVAQQQPEDDAASDDEETAEEPQEEDPEEAVEPTEGDEEDDLAVARGDEAPEDEEDGSIDASAGGSADDEEARAAALKRKQQEAWRERSTLTINATPWAEVSVNGRSVGRTPKRIRLRPGSYTILLQNPELQRAVRKQLKLGKGESKAVNHVFK